MFELIFSPDTVSYYTSFWGAIELLGTAFSLICVYLAAKHNQLTWLFGALGVICFGALFYEFQLYSDAGLQILFFLPVQLWGFLHWRKLAAGADDDSVTLGMNWNSIIQAILVIGLMTVINGYLMGTYTDASFPYADAWTTWMSIVAQILMIRKYWQSWVFWSVMDVGAIYIYFAKGLFVVSGLYVLFLAMAITGGILWYRDWKSQQLKINILSGDELLS